MLPKKLLTTYETNERVKNFNKPYRAKNIVNRFRIGIKNAFNASLQQLISNIVFLILDKLCSVRYRLKDYLFYRQDNIFIFDIEKIWHL